MGVRSGSGSVAVVGRCRELVKSGGVDMKVDLSRYVNRHSDKSIRLAWDVVWRLFAATTPRWMLQGWRRFLLKMFGAKIGPNVQVNGGASIWIPNLLEIGENSWIGDGANLYCVAPIKIGANAVVSEKAFICTAEHDISSVKFELKTAPITIGDMAWVGARAIILPGRNVGEGAVVAANSVVTHDVEPWTVVAGNPARVIKRREIVELRSDVSVVILVKNEEIHLRRCLKRLVSLNAKEIIVVDSESTDETEAIAKELGARFVVHKWPGTQARQFNWALENVEIKGKWILRLDADEYLTEDSIEWIKDSLDGIDDKVDALEFILERKFMGHEIRHATNSIGMVRMFRKGRGRYADILMDERIIVDGEVRKVPVVFYDDNLNDLSWWKIKHHGYAKREAKQAMVGASPDSRKARYYAMPRYWRAVAYFLYRYFLLLGFLDGVAGFEWHFWQGLWYRWLVDMEIGRLMKSGGK